MCLGDQVIDDKGSGIIRVRWSHGLSNDDGGVDRGQGVHNASEGSETTMEVAGDGLWTQGIYDDDRGVGGGR